MANDMIADLTKAAAQFMAIRASTGIAGGGVAGFLLSSVATKAVGKLFDKPKKDAEDGTKAAGTADSGPEDIGRRIGEAAAEAIRKILAEQFKANPNASGTSSSGPKLPRPDDKQTAQEYVNSLTPEQLQILRNGGKPAGTAANAVAQQAAAPAMARVTGAVAGPAAGAAGGAAGGAGAGGAAAGGASSIASAVGPNVMAAAAGVGVGAVFLEILKSGKELAYAQEQYARKLGEVNPTIAAQNIELDVNRMMRDIESGDRLADSNKELISAINRFENSTRTFEDLGNRLKNAIAADVMNGIAATLQGIEELTEAIYDGMPNHDKGDWKKFKEGEHEQSFGTFGDFLDEVNRRSQIERSENQRRQANNRQALDGGREW
jgi:hypothetical protein